MKEIEFWYKNWARAGLVGAIFILILLFFNSNAEKGSIIWLLWLTLPLYMFHQYEEYVFPGGFTDSLNKTLTRSSEVRILTDKMAFFINIILIWIQTPLFVILGYFVSPIFSVSLTTLVFVNGIVHFGIFLKFKKYNPGLIMSILFNLPLGIYLLIRIANDSFANPLEMVIGIILGVILHGLLLVFLLIQKKRML
ncbi:MAG: HXXEE domain-containing protein [Promethearchaeota archaeon]